MSGRLTPPDNQDGPFGLQPEQVGVFDQSTDMPSREEILDGRKAQEIARQAWDASTNWLNTGRRLKWDQSLRSFNNMHWSGSKYSSNDYRYRSTKFRPKTRAMVRRDEASTAAAFFSNDDVVSITAEDDDDPHQLASAEILKQLVQYRLTKTIPWFMTVIGARQDAEVMGLCVGKATWAYEERFLRTEMRPNEMGEPEEFNLYEKIKDEPVVDLLAPENVRFEPGCDWRDPVKTSPYWIEADPVYIGEALQRMESQHGAPAEWLPVTMSALRGASDIDDDATRRSRESNRSPSQTSDTWKPRDFDICWTRMNIIRWGGQDWCFRTLSNGGQLLEPPRPIKEVYLHGERPYVVGTVVLEAHKTYPSSKVELTADLQRAANEDWNSRFDAVMLGLQPRQFIRSGHGIDINDMRTFMPGKIVEVPAAKDMAIGNVIQWDRPPPVDGASFQEQDRINLDWDDLTGAFTNSSVQASQVAEQSATGMHLMSGEASSLGEYELRLFAESWVEPMLRLLIKLEQAYETDEVILALAGKKAQLMERFGVNQITDDLLNQSVMTKVNVGIGSTNPSVKLKNFAMGAQIIGNIFGPSAAMGANFEEVSKEVFGILGYKDGERFFKPDFDPRVQMLQQQMQKMQGKGGAPNDGPQKLQAAQVTVQGKLQEQQMKSETDERVAMLDFHGHVLSEQEETKRAILNAQRELATAHAAPTGLPPRA